MSFWPKCAPNISFFASFTSVPSQEKIPITETEGHFGPNLSYQIGSVWFWDCFFANDIVFCNLYCFCAGYWLHGVSLERRECSELLFAKIRTIWDCYFVWDCVFLQLRLFLLSRLFCAGYRIHVVSLERRECSELLFANIGTVWCYPVSASPYTSFSIILFQSSSDLKEIFAIFWDLVGIESHCGV